MFYFPQGLLCVPAEDKMTQKTLKYRMLLTEEEKRRAVELEKTGARVLLIAGREDEAWPAELSVRTIEH